MFYCLSEPGERAGARAGEDEEDGVPRWLVSSHSNMVY